MVERPEFYLLGKMDSSSFNIYAGRGYYMNAYTITQQSAVEYPIYCSSLIKELQDSLGFFIYLSNKSYTNNTDIKSLTTCLESELNFSSSYQIPGTISVVYVRSDATYHSSIKPNPKDYLIIDSYESYIMKDKDDSVHHAMKTKVRFSCMMYNEKDSSDHFYLNQCNAVLLFDAYKRQ